MIIIPAIDLKGEKVVRLLRGDYSQEKIYSDDPVSIAERWQKQGAQILHIVDLDGSLSGEFKNLSIIKKISSAVKIKIHAGGGVRSTADIKTLLDCGVSRVIIGTKAFTDDNFLKNILADQSLKNSLESVIVSIDTESFDGLNYYLKTCGWTKNSEVNALDALKRVEQEGIGMAVVTDIARDGTLSGPNSPFLESMLRSTKMQLIASGGVSNLEDIKKLKELSLKYNNLFAAITGKAIYEGTLNLKEAISNAK